MSDEKYLIRKQVIIDGGLKMKDEDVILPFANIEVKMPAGSTVDSTVTLASEEAMNDMVNSSVANAHKVIAGEFKVDTQADADAAIASYAAGGNLLLENGRTFNNGNAVPGEVIFMVPNTGSTFKTEEIVIGAAKEMIMLSDENAIGARVTTLEGATQTNAAAIALKIDSTDVDAKVLVETQARIAADSAIDTTVAAVSSKADDAFTEAHTAYETNFEQDKRIQALEDAEDLSDKLWEGSIPLVADIDLSTITDSNGVVFEFNAGDKLFVYIDESGIQEVGHELIVGNTKAVPYVLGVHSFQVKLDSTGKLTTVEGSAGDFQLMTVNRVLEEKASNGISASYTKNDANARFASKTTLEALSTTVQSKQDSIDQAISDGIDGPTGSNTKSVVGAINALHTRTTNTEDDTKLLNAGTFDVVGDGTVIVQMLNADGSLTDAFKALVGIRTDAEINALIDAKLNVQMSVTFDDTSTGAYKIGD